MMKPVGEVSGGPTEESIKNFSMADEDFSRGESDIICFVLTIEYWLQCGALIISPGCLSE